MDVRSSRQATLAPMALAFATLFIGLPGLAQRDHRTGPPQHWRGDISRFQQHDRQVWRGGHWIHGRHNGHLGWWWTAGGLWYLYPAPVYPYPDPWVPPTVLVPNPPATVMPPGPPAQSWYYCEAARTYYPYVATCPDGWNAVPAAPANVSPVPQ